MKTSFVNREITIIETHDLDILGETIKAYRGSDNFLYVSINMLCNILQLNPDDELQHIKKHAILREGIIRHEVKGINNFMELFRLDCLSLWLAYIDFNKISNKNRQEIELYQRGASIILHEAICSGEISNFESLSSRMADDDLLMKAYKEAVGLVGIVRTKILQNTS